MKVRNTIQSAAAKAGSSISLSIFVIALLLLMWPDAFGSQAPSYPDLVIPIPHPMTSLLRSGIIHKKLGLLESQIDDLEKTISQVDQPLWRLRDLPAQERNEKAAPLIMQLKEKVAGILSEKQLERFNQLVWQAKGVDAILELEIRAGLNLTPQQTLRIRTLLNTSRSRFATLQKDIGTGSQSRRRARLMRLRAQTQKDIFNVLDNRQQRAYAAFNGNPFFDLSKVPNIACRAPEIEVDTWLNSPPVKLSELKGKVTLVHFYAFGCGNCIRNLPHYNDWQNRFDKEHFQIIGIHRPETQYERDIEIVKAESAETGMKYPIAVDNESLTWDSYANNVWPSIYIIDKQGFVRYWWYGELNWQGAQTEKYLRGRIQELIEEPLQ